MNIMDVTEESFSNSDIKIRVFDFRTTEIFEYTAITSDYQSFITLKIPGPLNFALTMPPPQGRI